MKPPFKSQDDLIDLGPEVKSYIYQTIIEFEPYSTPQTQVSVIAKNPLRLRKQLLEDGVDIPKQKLQKMWRISISIFENGARVEQEALHENILEAIKAAKDKILKVLGDMQDRAISSSDRQQQINDARQNVWLH